MANFVIQHRKNDIVYNTIEDAREAILSIRDGVDGEIVVSRYLSEGEEVKSIKGVCYNDGSEYNWTIFSYDDDMIANLSIEGADVDLSGYLKKSEFNSYSSLTQTTINNKVPKDEFGTYKDEVAASLSKKLDKSAYDTYTATTKTTLQNLESNKADKNKAVGSAYYNAEDKKIKFKAVDGTAIESDIDASVFLMNGMVEKVEITIGTGENEGKDVLKITWNSDSDTEPTEIPLEKIFNPSNYYTKDEIDSKVKRYETYEAYESDAEKDLTDICFIEGDKMIEHNGVEYKTMTWKIFEELEEEYMEIVTYDSESEEIKVWLGSELDEVEDVSKLKPIGIVVIPKSHNVYDDGSCGVMSLVSMSLTTPDVGNVGKDITKDLDYQMAIGNSGHGITVHSTLPSLGSMVGPLYSTIQGVCDSKAHLPTDYMTNDMGNGIVCPTDIVARYMPTTDADRYYAPSPYSGNSRNELYYATNNIISDNALSYFNGKENTEMMIDKATAQSDWRTSQTLTDSVASGYYPAACACWRFHTDGTEQGEWYLPSIAECGYIGVRYGKINRTLTYINEKFNGEYTTPIDYTSLQNIWSSSYKGGNGYYCMSTKNASIANRTGTESNKAQTRAFLKLTY